MTIFIIDRYLQVDGLLIKRNKFQLLGVTAMFTASKVRNGAKTDKISGKIIHKHREFN